MDALQSLKSPYAQGMYRLIVLLHNVNYSSFFMQVLGESTLGRRKFCTLPGRS